MGIGNTIRNIITAKKIKIVENRWVFTSFSGHYSDSPKYLSIKLHEMNPSIEIVWCVSAQYKQLLPNYVVYAEYGSKEANEYLASAAVIIDNVYGGRAFTVFGNHMLSKLKAKFLRFGFYKKQQMVYTTWHGTPLKKMGRDQIGNNITGFECCNIKMLLGNQFTSDIMKHLTFNKIPIEVMGTPRNDILFLNKDEVIKESLGIPTDKKTLLFAPTFRNDGKDVEGKNLNKSGINQLNMINFERLFKSLHDKFGGEWVLICRFHYHVAQMVDWAELNKKYNGRIINGNLHDDMSEYLACADVLLTDASSCMFDFIITNKPCLLFFPDIDNYANKERGFYIPIEKLPFPLATNFDDLITVIKRFNNDEYVKGIDKIRSEFGYMEDGESSQRILEWIFKDAGY